MYYPNVIYHIYNQSNHRQVVFRNPIDYHDFECKLRDQLVGVAHILCYCLMPTHFHLMALVKQNGLELIDPGKPSVQAIYGTIRSMLSSFVRKVNGRYGGRGSLFRPGTRYVAGYKNFIPENEELDTDTPFTHFIPYLKTCFRYVHNNPVAAGLVPHATDWNYSSALDYAGQRDLGICNYDLTERLLGIRRLAR